MALVRSAFFLCVLAISAQGATYYIDYSSGSDSNDGMSKVTPWKRQPYMAGFSGQYSHAVGDRFIFKGGVTWNSSFPILVQAAGTGSTNDYYGVDQRWFNGSTWVKPIFDAQYVAEEIFNIESIAGNITIDNLELSHINCTTNYGAGLIDGGAPSNVLISNCHLHGWQVTTSTDDAHGGVIFNAASAGIGTVIISNTEIENSENSSASQAGNGVCCRDIGQIVNSKIHDNSSAVLFCLDFNGSELYNITGNSFDPTYHTNGIYLDCQTLNQTVGYIRNSYLHDVAGGANMAYPNPRGASIYVYNNVMYGTMSAQQAVEIDPYNYGSGSTGACYVYNNTIVVPSDNYTAVRVVPRSPQLDTLVLQNNQVIGNGVSVTDGTSSSVTNLTQDHNIVEQPSDAAQQGYVLANLYAPTSASDPTVNTGTSAPSSVFNTDILGFSRPQGAAWNIGAYEFVSGSSAPTPTPTPSPQVPLPPQNLHIVT